MWTGAQAELNRVDPNHFTACYPIQHLRNYSIHRYGFVYNLYLACNLVALDAPPVEHCLCVTSAAVVLRTPVMNEAMSSATSHTSLLGYVTDLKSRHPRLPSLAPQKT